MTRGLKRTARFLIDWLLHSPADDISVADCNEAGRKEGWMIVPPGDGRHAQRQLRSTSATPRLQDDVAAWRHVVERAQAGSRLHRAALEKLCESERWMIQTHCAWIGSGC
jgi:hypothetical protein